MTQDERRSYLIQELFAEQPQYGKMKIPKETAEQKRLLRALMNVRMPQQTSETFLQVQDEYLREAAKEKGITEISSLQPVQEGIYLWKGDITTLRCGAIVNAANSRMLGCFCPNHGCIDNAIHTYAGVQLRAACQQLMRAQDGEEETGKAKLTSAYNLPCDYVLHTVGPIVRGKLTEKEEIQLASCYQSCLESAAEHEIKSIAFCCISTGEFHFPNKRAAEIAVQTVKRYQAQRKDTIEVIFNVFKDSDYDIYRKLLCK